MSTAILTPTAVLSFPQLFTPRPRSEGAKPVYSCSLLFDAEAQATAEYKAMQQATVDAAKAKFGANVNLKQVMFPFRDAGEKTYTGYEPGMTFINPWSETPPTVVDEQVQDVINPNLIYAGQNVRAYLVAKGWLTAARRASRSTSTASRSSTTRRRASTTASIPRTCSSPSSRTTARFELF